MGFDTPVYIIARTREGARSFARVLDLDPGDWVYLDTPGRLRGVTWFRYIIQPSVEIPDELRHVVERGEYIGQRELNRMKLLDRMKHGKFRQH